MVISEFLNSLVCAQKKERLLSSYEGRVWPIANEANESELWRYLLSKHLMESYAIKKKESLIYRRIFYFLSLLFLCLLSVVYTYTINIHCTYFFYPCFQIKNWIMILALGASVLSLLVGLYACPEKEAKRFIAKKIQYDLH